MAVPNDINYATPVPRQPIRWVNVLAMIALAIGLAGLASSLLLLSTAGGFVDTYLFAVAFCTVSIAISKNRTVTFLAVLVSLSALALIHRDHEQGLL
jgi:hypothetical protein